MKNQARLVVGLTVLIGAALIAVTVSADRPRPPTARTRLRLIEQHFADLATSTDTVEAQLQALAVRVAALEAQLQQCGCQPPPSCLPCQEQGLCTTDGQACGQDADGDGIDDCLDACPCEPGAPENGGCAPLPPPPCAPCTCTVEGVSCGHDADGDGIDDCLDRCPCEPGPAESAGCPRPICEPCASCQVVPCGHDADGDGVDDCADSCPCRAGVPENHGCPAGTSCGSDADCQDGNPCSLDVCIGGICEHKCLCLAADGFDCGPGPAAR